METKTNAHWGKGKEKRGANKEYRRVAILARERESREQTAWSTMVKQEEKERERDGE
jgi:hypothetical protein